MSISTLLNTRITLNENSFFLETIGNKVLSPVQYLWNGRQVELVLRSDARMQLTETPIFASKSKTFIKTVLAIVALLPSLIIGFILKGTSYLLNERVGNKHAVYTIEKARALLPLIVPAAIPAVVRAPEIPIEPEFPETPVTTPKAKAITRKEKSSKNLKVTFKKNGILTPPTSPSRLNKQIPLKLIESIQELMKIDDLQVEKLSQYGLTKYELQTCERFLLDPSTKKMKLQIHEKQVDVERDSLKTLVNGIEVNDEIINSYLELNRIEAEGVLSANSFFFEQLQKNPERDWKKLLRTSQNENPPNIFNSDFLVIPIHENNHWTLLSVDLKKQVIHYYDSLNRKNTSAECKILQNLLKKETASLKKSQKNTWTIKKEKCPQQNNAIDCGIFTLATAKQLFEKKQLTHTQEDIPYIRLAMLAQLLSVRI